MKSVKIIIIIGILSLMPFNSDAQLNAKLMRYVDVSENHITFVFGGDIWVVNKSGGTAIQLTSSPGEEMYPRFSPDGQEIAYSAYYHGNLDVYVLPVSGGIPHRVTYQSLPDRLVDWHPDGKRLLFASRRELGQRSGNQLFLVNKSGGLSEKLPIPYGELASFSSDGSKLAYTMRITENYPFKRYRGGLETDVIIFDLNDLSAKKIKDNDATQSKPVWVDNSIYYLSDEDENMRRNIWMYNTESDSHKQLTLLEDFDITYMSAGPNDLVYEAGGELYTISLQNEVVKNVKVNIISDLTPEMPKIIDVSGRISNVSPSPSGKRLLIEARGEIFNIPSKDGYKENISRNSGAFDRDPAWSPDGKNIAYWSDATGEFEIWLKDNQNNKQRKITNRNKGFGYKLFWSPDSKSIAFLDEQNQINVINISTGTTKVLDKMIFNLSHPGRLNFPLAWSPDSKYLTYSKTLDNANNAIFVVNTVSGKIDQLTSGFFNDSNPVFDINGKFLFFITDRSFNAAYSGLGDGTWIYPNNSQIALVSLNPDTPSPFKPKNDESGNEKDSDNSKNGDQEIVNISISVDNMESRIDILPISSGNYGNLFSVDGKIVYMKFPNTGSENRSSSLKFYDITELEEKTIIDGINSAQLTSDGKSVLVSSRGKYGYISPSPDQKIKDPVNTSNLTMEHIPREEWRQLFNDTWRRHRDFFYDPAMQGVNWDEMRERYGALIEEARTRWDINFIIGELNSELSAGHTYAGGGDLERFESKSTGYLGIDWAIENGKYKIKRIVYPAVWDTEVRSPFDQSGVEVQKGHYIHKVNGIPLDGTKDPYAPFEGLSGKTVSLLVSPDGNETHAKKILIKCLTPGQEVQLRNLEWIENNRKMVEELSEGKLGYVYMSNTSGRGQLELIRHFYGQLDKKGFVIDERYNGGGQLADRFMELMLRPVVYNLHWRHGKDHTHPIKTNTGPLGMLINGSAGSGGDGLPWAFQELKAGPIVGERTLGILVGPATGHQLIDGGYITVPGARLYDNDGHWFWEGYGVSPDFEVWDDPSAMAKGRDPQMEKVVEEVLKLLDKNPPIMTPAPPPEDRTAGGQKKN